MPLPYPLSPTQYELLATSASSFARIDADTERFAFKFYADRSSQITHVNPYFDVNGTVTGVTFAAEIQTDSSDVPSGTVVGAATAGFAGPASDGFVGAQALATPTGALTTGNPYWLVVYRSGGSSVSGTNWVQPFRATSYRPNREKMRHFNGTDWTTDGSQNGVGGFVLTHGDGSISGMSVVGTNIASPQTDIFGTNRQGIRWKVGAQLQLSGVSLSLAKNGSPANLEVVVYEGSTEKGSRSVTAALIEANTSMNVYFTSPITLAANTNLYAILRQAGDGGSDSADYDLRVYNIDSTTIAAVLPSDFRMVAGTGNDPTALSVVTTESPWMFPLYDDPASDFSGPAAEAGYQMGLV